MYTRRAYALPEDGRVHRSHPRAIIADDLAPLDSLRAHPSDPIPFHERHTSPLAYTFRAPHLHRSWWIMAESSHDPQEYIGLRIQIYSIVHSIQFRTVYWIESTGHPLVPWKRIIITHHFSEELPFLPHRIAEISP